jgi:hypothetical protein
MKRRYVETQEKRFIVREDELDELAAHSDWLRRGVDKVEGLKIAQDILVIIGKCRARSAP